MNKLLKKILRLILPGVLGGFILFWMYRDFDFAQVRETLLHGINWGWMLLSLLCGVLPQVFRGWRWRQTLEPLGAFPKRSDCVNAIFISYAASLVVPRIGEVSRCGILSKYDQVSFTQSLGTVVTDFISYAASLVVPRIGEVSRCGILSKYDQVSFTQSLGTVVTERLIDTLAILLIAGVTFLLQMPVFVDFFQQTGTKIPSVLHLLTSVWFYILLIAGVTFLLQMPVFVDFFQQTGTKIPSVLHLLTSVWFYIVLFCFIGVVLLLYSLRKTLFFYERVKGVVLNVWEGVMSLKSVRNLPLFLFYTVAIWGGYFLHFYFTFYCFGFTASLGVMAALVMFVGGTFAVIVPTPNGAGPWHFAIISMMMLYGVNATDAGIFALIVHGIQTFLVALLGVYGLAALSLTNRQTK